MIEFREVTPEHGKIFYDGSQIGIYKNFKWLKKIELIIDYQPLTTGYDLKHKAPNIAERIHLKQKDMFRRKLVKEHKLRNSIYNTNQEYTIR